MQIRKMNDACKIDGIYATYSTQVGTGIIGTYAQRLAINSEKPPTYQYQVYNGFFVPYNEAIYL
jgi:hypothetical protein